MNACLMFLPQLNGKTLTTVEGLAGPDGALHPVQAAMVDHHASQCGFCTPGIVVSLAAGQIAGEDEPRPPAFGQPVPLHRLRADPARGRGRGRQAGAGLARAGSGRRPAQAP